ncbi:MAG: tyrosine-type recombinase/integrase [Rhodopseudomonas palustris]|uniref:Tyrosine-type recombinase/integrase n=1 Tax=Rhodopseudomonas palustris TaxID=1076 RepID=A0A933RYT7_RHOPL|nr:tyrosine-type recombinase/integrase [Rhodopseudomonas palustris]
MHNRFTEIYPLTTKVIRLPEGDRHVLTVNAKGFPVDWPNLYCMISLRPSSMALSTMQTHATAICMLHNWCGDQGIPLQERIEKLDLFTMSEIAALRFAMRVNRSPGSESATVEPPHWSMRLKAISAYIAWHGDHVLSRMSARDERWPAARKRLTATCKRINGTIKHRKGKKKEGLEKDQQTALATGISLGHPKNPFNANVQPRNLALIAVYSEGGLRRGEGGGLKICDMHLNGNEPYIEVERRPDDPDDPRAQEPNTKTEAHPVPIGTKVARLLGDYMIYDRPNYKNARKSPYVFLSQEGQPLSLSSIDQVFRALRAVPGVPKDFSPNSLRRTWNDRVGDAAELLGIAPELEMQIRNQAQGRVRHSGEAMDYQRGRLRRRGNAIAIRMQDIATKDGKND